ncbi:Mevalonate pyrophosphate decarboxylase [Candidatus Ornithobacterium hominis]|uniref:diphosphomevalonate/mevalonate 3,5-bisphosphate decarboxylase family protein n=1 Tax=Candidatus Ornithobacterium hominis TaxID=2497989 RepID=UPI0024BCA591|nr:diphosphomevalonate decarboxylase [Candidatus Ornithobacterium hominis]CAI9428841.1 Mevalonate pyrophosphate decarboxylase [Candidatus Ornithobacterium hominis]
MRNNFITSISDYNLQPTGSVKAKGFSNIALIKYWGKYSKQIPANPSLSFTLSEAFTQTELKFKEKRGKKTNIQVFLDGTNQPDFAPKIEKFFQSIIDYIPFIHYYDFEVHTHNSFPHSSGIASSASGMSALASCLIQMEEEFGYKNEKAIEKASFLARLGSGSASRSLYPGAVVWGKTAEIEGSNNEFSISINHRINPIFQDFQDCILLIHKGKKRVSSTLGHQLMNEHLFAEQRFKQADQNLKILLKALEQADIDTFIRIVEKEALSLHAMMMTSDPYFILMEPQTVKAIQEIWRFREETGEKICFTLDAGANVHVLYPKQSEKNILTFINERLKSLCENQEMLMDYVNQKI